jgi:hypothetical protein
VIVLYRYISIKYNVRVWAQLNGFWEIGDIFFSLVVVLTFGLSAISVLRAGS